jgi:putative transposase
MIAKPNDRRRVRLQGADYTAPGAYFVTICAYRRWSIFGRVVDGRMQPNALGRLVAELWNEIPQHVDSVTLDCSVVMPNHLHGIVVITGTVRDTACRVPTFGRPIAGSLATIVRSFKAAVRKEAARRIHLAQPVWQPRFYEHVIRDDEDLARIREYITAKPSKWAEDHENPARSS